MKVRLVGALTGATAISLGLTLTATGAGALSVPAVGPAGPEQQQAQKDNYSSPRADAAATLRQEAVTKLVQGKASTKEVNGKTVIEVQSETSGSSGKKGSKGTKGKQSRYVEYDVDRTASIFTVLSQFGTATKPTAGGTAGPSVNQIPQPDRTQNNSTYWESNFDRQHYLDMMFGTKGESFKNFYKAQSQGRFDVKGDVSDWVTLPYNEAAYGSNKYSNDAIGYWAYISDTLTAWYNQQKASGKTDAQIKDYLSQFDQWDRYDYDGDGNFDEPDGYIDHFQAIHAGEGEEAGGGAQGEDAIWSHRWAVGYGYGSTGPGTNKGGGVQIGNTGIWVSDYTTEPENGGLGVFTHEFGHDLGLPDLYDTTNKATNSTSFWTLMSAGSWLNHGKDDIGTTPGYMGAWEKLQLGWLDFKTVSYGSRALVNLGPADLDNRKKPQALAVTLPNKTVVTDYNKPKSGSYEWWSGRGDNYTSSLTRDLDLTSATTASVSAAIWYDIEQDYDFLYPQVSTDGGGTWTNVGNALTGSAPQWGSVSYDLSAYKGQKVKFRFLYQTDGGVNEAGAFLDDLALTVDGTTTVDDVESATSAWTATGFSRMTGSTSKQVSHYYLAEYRRYAGYDVTLKQGPYNFGWYPDPKPDYVEHFPYQDGLLVWYVNNEFVDNNVFNHPGGGQVLPVDAHPTPLKWSTGQLMSNRISPFDATFGTERTDAFTLHRLGVETKVPSQAAVRTFDDSSATKYWSAESPYASTKTAGSGTKISVLTKLGDGMVLYVDATKKR